MQQQITRVAGYVRVSTEEQFLHGYSLPAQEEALTSFAQANNMRVVKMYRDEGHSARKPAMKRPVMLELLEDVKAGKIDQIIFIKLDRWFRNVREYHKIQEILEQNSVTWKAILEDYNTATADGRLKVNIMLSVAENEADRTSERIKFVFDAKRRRKELCFGGPSKPFGYKAEKIDGIRRLVKDPETEQMCEDFWDHVRKYQSVRLAGMYVNEKYGIERKYRVWTSMARNEFYTGTYRGVVDFCPAYIDHKDWEYLQQSPVHIKKTQSTGRVYLFTGLIRCPVCGKTLKSNYKASAANPEKEWRSYRCNNGNIHLCDYRNAVSELKVEKYLLEHIREEINAYIVQVEASGKQKKKPSAAMDVVKLTEQMRRLNKVYMAGNMTDEEYTKETTALKKKIETAKTAEKDERPPDLEILKRFAASDFENIYTTLSPEDKRRLWRSIIAEIHVEGNAVKEIIFRA